MSADAAGTAAFAAVVVDDEDELVDAAGALDETALVAAVAWAGDVVVAVAIVVDVDPVVVPSVDEAADAP